VALLWRQSLGDTYLSRVPFNCKELFMATKKSVENSGDKFIEEVKASLDEAEKLMREAAEATGDKAGELREKALRSLRLTRDSLHDAQEAVVDHSLRAAKATDNYVHDKPWQAIGVAGIVGLMFGMLISRR
jgi:ElaB/YqjD/DUF883 family membrane-anchored ribosome-binding protein